MDEGHWRLIWLQYKIIGIKTGRLGCSQITLDVKFSSTNTENLLYATLYCLSLVLLPHFLLQPISNLSGGDSEISSNSAYVSALPLVPPWSKPSLSLSCIIVMSSWLVSLFPPLPLFSLNRANRVTVLRYQSAHATAQNWQWFLIFSESSQSRYNGLLQSTQLWLPFWTNFLLSSL